MKNLICPLLIVFTCLSCKKEPPVTVSIIPQPDQMVRKEGSFEITDRTRLIFQGVGESEKLIRHYFQIITSFELPVGNEMDEQVILFALDDQRRKNEYQISSSPEKVIVKAGSNESMLYAVQTLRQLLLQNNGRIIPALEITDFPRFGWRGLLLDCSRHFMDKEFVKRYIDLLALYKMNVLHWHFTEDQGWRIQIDQYPKLTEVGAWRADGKGGMYGGFYTKEEIREVVTYAAERGIMVVPEIELPGHSQAALAAYPQFSCTGGPFEVETEWGVFKEIYCAGNDSTFIFLEDVLSEVIELFPSEYIHIGGDEVPKFRWEHCSKCQRRIAEEGLKDEHELQSYFVGRIGRFLESRGKKMIGWDEILEGGLPEGATVQSWRGYEGAIQAVRSGHSAILSPTSHSYFDYGLNDIDMEKVYSFDPIPEGITDEEKTLILGGECNMWSERAPQPLVDRKVFPRLLAMSEVLWSYPEDRDFEAFRTRVRENYKVLDKMGVNYGFETVPVKVTTRLSGDQLEAVLIPYDSSLNVFYQVDDRKDLYEGPVKITNPAKWAITFGKGETQFKDTIYQRFDPHLANGLDYQLSVDPNKNYTAGGDRALTDGLKGSGHFRDGNWQGYWGEDVQLVLDLGKETDINQLSAGFLQYTNAWIFFPRWVDFYWSLDGDTYSDPVRVVNNDIPENKEQKTQQYVFDPGSPTRVRYLKISAKNLGECPEWHDAAGSPTWLFIDEFSVK